MITMPAGAEHFDGEYLNDRTFVEKKIDDDMIRWQDISPTLRFAGDILFGVVLVLKFLVIKVSHLAVGLVTVTSHPLFSYIVYAVSLAYLHCVYSLLRFRVVSLWYKHQTKHKSEIIICSLDLTHGAKLLVFICC